MKDQEVEVLKSISTVQKHQGMLVQKIRSPQQAFLHVWAHRYLLQKKMMHRQLQQVLTYLPGSFGHQALYVSYLTTCLQMKLQLNPEDFLLIKRLLNWSDSYPKLRKLQQLSLIKMVTPVETVLCLNSFQQYVAYLNFIAPDLIKLIVKGKQEQQTIRLNFKSIDAQDLLQFLLNSLPKVLFNVILSVDVLPPQYRQCSMQILYRNTNSEYFMRQKQSYTNLIKILIKILLKLQLKQSQQKKMMQIIFRYFLCYHYDAKYQSTQLFIQAFNVMSQSVRFAMADQFVLFFKIIKKIGKGKFWHFLMEKSEWLKNIYQKVTDGNIVGYSKDTLYPFPALKFGESVLIGNGKKEYREFQVLEDYSLFYFVADIVSQDITIRINYLGDFDAKENSCKQLLVYQRQKILLKAHFMAAKKGIYQFQFDNSYSWVNKKLVRLEKVVLTPLQFQSQDAHSWINSYYDSIPLNQIKDKSKLYVIHKRQVSKPKKESISQGVGNITKIDKYFNLKVRRGNSMYEFESESEDKLVTKFQQILDLGGKVNWMVNGQPIQDPQNLKTILIKDVEKIEQKEQNMIPQQQILKKEEKLQKQHTSQTQLNISQGSTQKEVIKSNL